MAAMGLRKRFLVAVVGVPGSPAEAQRSEVGRFRSRSAAEQAGADEWRRILFVHAPHVDRYRVVIEDDGVEVGDVPMPELPADAAPGILDETVTPLGASVGALGEPIEPDAAPEADPEPAPAPGSLPESAPEPTPEPTPEPQDEAGPEAGAASAADELVPDAIEATGELEVIEADDLAATGEHKGLADAVADDAIAATGEVPVVTDDDAGGDAPPGRPRPYLEIEEPPDGPVPDDIINRFAEMVKAEEERAAERAARERADGD